MVSKRITIKKIATGYSITVIVKDRDVFQDLHVGIVRFFNKIKQQEEEDTALRVNQELKVI